MAGMQEMAVLCSSTNQRPLHRRGPRRCLPVQGEPCKGQGPFSQPETGTQGGKRQLQGFWGPLHTSSFFSCSFTGFKAVEASSFHV